MKFLDFISVYAEMSKNLIADIYQILYFSISNITDVYLFQFDRFISSKGVHPDNSGHPFVFMCDGQLHFRLTLHPEASRKNFQLAHYFSRFYDIRKEFKKMYKVEVVNCIKDMLDCIL